MPDIDTLLQNFLAPADIQMDYFAFLESILISTFMGLGIKYMYIFYFRANEPRDAGFARSLALLTPVLSSMFWLIQGSVALSLGLIGSMAFVRFRTPVKRSEDAVFLVLALTVAIACAVKAYLLVISLLAILSVFVLVRNYERQSSLNRGRNAVITLNLHRALTAGELSQPFQDENLQYELVSSRTFDGVTSYVFNVSKLIEKSYGHLRDYFVQLDAHAQINVFYPSHRLGA